MQASITERLAEPFDPRDIRWRPITDSGDKCLAAAYIDARKVIDRLNEVLGVDGWQDRYELLYDGNMMCHLSIWSEDKKQWLCKSDIGEEGQAPGKGTKAKASCSNALKRARFFFGTLAR